MKFCLVNVFRRVHNSNCNHPLQKVDSFEARVDQVVSKVERYSKESSGSVVKLDPNLEFELVCKDTNLPVAYLEPGKELFFAMQA